MVHTTSPDQHHFAISEMVYGQRLDKVLAAYFPQYSRSDIVKWIREDKVLIDDVVISKSSHLIKPEEKEIKFLGQNKVCEMNWGPQKGEFIVVFEEENFLVVNKAPDVVVHPAAGTLEGSLVNFLHYAYPELSKIERCGLVHRLDKGTSGLLLVAKTEETYHILKEMLKNRDIQREYCALVWGAPNAFGIIDKPIGRHPIFRKKMAILQKTGKEAQTRFFKVAQFKDCAFLRVVLKTGRTHQIRVHLSDLGYPLVGDRLYGGRCTCSFENDSSIEWDFPALHAQRLNFAHPITGKIQNFYVDPPEKFVETVRRYERESINESLDE